MTHVVETFCDESSDQQQKKILCVSGFVASANFWIPLEVRWMERLKRDGVKYFSSKECKAVQGPFRHLRKQCNSLDEAKNKAASIRSDLEDILVPPPELPPVQWHGFAVGVVISDYNHVLENFPIARLFYPTDPTVAAYSQIMYEVVRTVRRNLRGWGVAYVIDESNDFPKIHHAFQAMKKQHPTCGKSAKTCAPFDDKETPGLQMADLFTSAMRDKFEKWITDGRESEVGVDKWARNTDSGKVGLWDTRFMLKSLMRTLKHPRFKSGKLIPQLAPSKRQIRKMRRILESEELRNENAQGETEEGNAP